MNQYSAYSPTFFTPQSRVSAPNLQENEPYTFREPMQSRGRLNRFPNNSSPLSGTHPSPVCWTSGTREGVIKPLSALSLAHTSALMFHNPFETALGYPFNEFPCTFFSLIFFFFQGPHIYFLSLSLRARLFSRSPLELGEPLAALVGSLITLLCSLPSEKQSH